MNVDYRPAAIATAAHPPAATGERPSRLETYALAGLARCWMGERGTWSHSYHLDGRPGPNVSRPASDLYYSLNVLLGLSRLSGPPPAYCDLRDTLHRLCAAGQHLPVRPGFWGMALWAAHALGTDAPAQAVRPTLALGDDPAAAATWRAQDLGLALSGVCAQAVHDAAWTGTATRLHDLLQAQLGGPGPLFRDCGVGPRRHCASFATQVYAALSLYHYGELTGCDRAIAAANRCAGRLIALQGERGEWPWFYDVGGSRVLDRYEVYSVHQHGMAPALLHHAAAHGVAGARTALVAGFEWIFGANEMGVCMLRPDAGMILRSQARRGVAGERWARMLRAGAAAATGRGGAQAGARALRLTQEMRSYELGWLLWSFAGRRDYPHLTERAVFGRVPPGLAGVLTQPA